MPALWRGEPGRGSPGSAALRGAQGCAAEGSKGRSRNAEVWVMRRAFSELL